MAKAKKAAPRKLTGSVHVSVGKGATAKSIHSLLDSIFKQQGCLTCGLGGIDIHIRPGELILPELNKEAITVLSH
ncbi:MAG: hypothetical protein JNM95_13280 [Chitinophagaceae bacterium]|nr:hypothetical protein [Chitinophagaceae bacterium]